MSGRWGRRGLLGALLALLPAGAAAAGELTVFAAASLREPFEDLARRLEARTPGLKVRLSFAGSQELRVQIEHGARADAFASADLKHTDALVRAKLVGAARVFARNEPVIVVPGDDPGGVKALADLPRARRIVLGAPEVPIGAYARQILDRARATLGADFPARVLARVASNELNARLVLAKVSLGEADAGIVYRSDALAAGDRVRAVPIPPAVNVTAEYAIAVVTGARQPAHAEAFVALLLGPAGRQRLAAAGFLVR